MCNHAAMADKHLNLTFSTIQYYLKISQDHFLWKNIHVGQTYLGFFNAISLTEVFQLKGVLCETAVIYEA